MNPFYFRKPRGGVGKLVYLPVTNHPVYRPDIILFEGNLYTSDGYEQRVPTAHGIPPDAASYTMSNGILNADEITGWKPPVIGIFH